uniref:Uncharacterized protein n=1 Tax=Pipistrellus kuhlii TaxID=59472 RepID=A0A7J7VMH3_PIPKU|nr:hypothetical protein mPipKuh1_008420 [Pipistrellus kuhlii]
MLGSQTVLYFRLATHFYFWGRKMNSKLILSCWYLHFAASTLHQLPSDAGTYWLPTHLRLLLTQSGTKQKINRRAPNQYRHNLMGTAPCCGTLGRLLTFSVPQSLIWRVAMIVLTSRKCNMG